MLHLRQLFSLQLNENVAFVFAHWSLDGRWRAGFHLSGIWKEQSRSGRWNCHHRRLREKWRPLCPTAIHQTTSKSIFNKTPCLIAYNWIRSSALNRWIGLGLGWVEPESVQVGKIPTVSTRWNLLTTEPAGRSSNSTWAINSRVDARTMSINPCRDGGGGLFLLNKVFCVTSPNIAFLVILLFSFRLRNLSSPN